MWAQAGLGLGAAAPDLALPVAVLDAFSELTPESDQSTATVLFDGPAARPIQAVVLPIADRHLEYAATVRDQLRAAGLRTELDERQEKIGYKIREAQLQKVPYMLVVGDREAEQRTAAIRGRADGDMGAHGIDEFVELARQEIETRGRVGVKGLLDGGAPTSAPVPVDEADSRPSRR